MATKSKAKARSRAEAVELPPGCETFMGRDQVCKALGVGLRTFARMVADEGPAGFPPPDRRIGHLLKWRMETVNAYIRGGKADGLGR